MKKLVVALSILFLVACSEQPNPKNDADQVDVEAFLKTFDCKKLDQFEFENEELKRRTKIYCAMKSEHTPSKPERHTFG